MECPGCGRQVRGQAELCLFCGRRLRGGAGGAAARAGGRGRSAWILVASILLILLGGVLIALSGALPGVAARLQSAYALVVTRIPVATRPSAPAQALVPTNTPVPTPTPSSTPTSTPTQTPQATPTPALIPTPTLPPPDTSLLPKSGEVAGWPFALWAMGGVMMLLGWGWGWLRRRLTKR
jgi:hypothetical protein